MLEAMWSFPIQETMLFLPRDPSSNHHGIRSTSISTPQTLLLQDDSVIFTTLDDSIRFKFVNKDTEMFWIFFALSIHPLLWGYNAKVEPTAKALVVDFFLTKMTCLLSVFLFGFGIFLGVSC